MSGISTHILDTARGAPAAGVAVTLEREEAGAGRRWSPTGSATSDADGRVKALLPAGTPLSAGVYRVRFETGAYFAARGVQAFFPHVEVVFTVTDPARHHHVPLLLSPFGFSTYRGT